MWKTTNRGVQNERQGMSSNTIMVVYLRDMSLHRKILLSYMAMTVEVGDEAGEEARSLSLVSA